MIASALKRKSQAPPAGGIDNDPPVDSYVMNAAREDEEKVVNEDAALDTVIQTQVLKDRSPEAKRGRRQMLMRAVYGEFMATFLFFCPIFCTLANGHVSNWTPEGIQLTAALVTGFQGIGLAFAFSGISGALLNPAIAFALWLTGKLSNRRCIYFILVEMLASIVAMIVVTVIFSGGMGHIYNFLSVEPAEGANLGKVFATEAFLTFFLTYTAFTVAFEDAELQKKESMSIKKISDAKGLTLYATTPQSKTGFAPFSIGFVLLSISLISGTSGGACNPARMFGPAIFSGRWKYFYLYWLGQFFGAAMAGLLVNNLHQFGLKAQADKTTAVKSAGAILANTVPLQARESTVAHVHNPVNHA
jgi:glycerol uptake facilitator-like aquaporin